MVSLPFDPTSSVPAVDVTQSRPEPVQGPPAVNSQGSFGEHLERAQTKDTIPATTAEARAKDAKETEPVASEEEQVQAGLTDGQAESDSAEVTESEEAGKTESGESDPEQGDQSDSDETQDVVEISTEVVLIDETADLPTQEDVEPTAEDSSSEGESVEPSKPKQSPGADTELIDAPEASAAKHEPVPEQSSGQQESTVIESIPTTDHSEAEGAPHQIGASDSELVSASEELQVDTSDRDEPAVVVSPGKEQDSDGEPSTRQSKASEPNAEPSEATNKNSQNPEQEQSQQQEQRQQPYASAKSSTATQSTKATSEEVATSEVNPVVNPQVPNSQVSDDTSQARELGAASQTKAQSVEKVEATGSPATNSTNTEAGGELGTSTSRQSTGRVTASATAEATTTEPAPDVSRVRFVQRVARAFQSVGPEGGEVRLRLSPPELGALRLEVTVQRGVLSARLETETPAARILLLDNMPALRERLEQQDIKIANFDVDLMDQPPEGMQDNPSDDAQWQREYRERNSRTTESAEESTKSGPVGPIQSGEQGALNVVV